MTDVWHISITDEARMRLLAELVATKVSAGDMITLRGDLGAGKTTFSRYLIRSLLDDDAAEVPSPTFTLVQTYATARFDVRHFDLYRIGDADELDELEFQDGRGECLTLVEWPERATDLLGTSRFDIVIADGDTDCARHVSITATPEAAWRLERMQAAYAFVCRHHNDTALQGVRLSFLQGDASARSYARLDSGEQQQLLMDMPRMPDGPIIRDGKTYSEIAHLAEDAQPFVSIAHEMRTAGLSAPEIYAFDEALGIALIEDLGPLTFAEAMKVGIPQDQLWHAAVEVLVALRAFPPAAVVGANCGVRHRMPIYDADVMRAEIALLGDWYWPYALGRQMTADERAGFEAKWAPYIEMVAAGSTTENTSAWVQRDFHSPNLIWMPERDGIAKVGVIDFQDAQIGHAAYDLVSLSLDARLDVPRALHDALLDSYCAQVGAAETAFDHAAFRQAAAILGAQRNTKILGIFARLSMRDGKHGYLRHIPRIKHYLGWCLEHPELYELREWFDTELGLSE